MLVDLLRYYERDEARHVALGVLHLPRLIQGMTSAEAAGLWAWEFGELWAQLEMMRELTPHFEVLGLDVRRVLELGRAKQIRANQMLIEEMGSPIPVFDAFIRFFDARCAWHWPDDPRADLRGRLQEALRAANQGIGVIPTHLSNVAT